MVIENQVYTYDKVFGEDDTTQEIYTDAASDIVLGVTKGMNGTIFACKS
jgi:hypothetical protein